MNLWSALLNVWQMGEADGLTTVAGTFGHDLMVRAGWAEMVFEASRACLANASPDESEGG